MSDRVFAKLFVYPLCRLFDLLCQLGGDVYPEDT